MPPCVCVAHLLVLLVDWHKGTSIS
jgi:hypothetical protein